MASCHGVAVMTAAPKNSARFHARLAALYRAGTYCDTKIVCKGQNFPVMKNMMCLQSDVFERSLSGKSREAKEELSDLALEDPETIKYLLELCHCFKYHLVDDATPAIVHRLRIYAAGDNYTIPELESLALKNFRSECLVRWEHVDFAGGIREAYLCSDYPIVRKTIQNVALAAHDALIAMREQYQPFWDVAVQVPEFARDMLLALSLPRHPPVGKRYVCPSCSKSSTSTSSQMEDSITPATSKTYSPCTRTVWPSTEPRSCF